MLGWHSRNSRSTSCCGISGPNSVTQFQSLLQRWFRSSLCFLLPKLRLHNECSAWVGQDQFLDRPNSSKASAGQWLHPPLLPNVWARASYVRACAIWAATPYDEVCCLACAHLLGQTHWRHPSNKTAIRFPRSLPRSHDRGTSVSASP